MPAARKPRNKPRASTKRTPTAAERKRRAAESAAAKPPDAPEVTTEKLDRPMRVALVPVEDENGALPEGAQALNGVMLALSDSGELALIPVGINALMMGDILSHAQAMHAASFKK